MKQNLLILGAGAYGAMAWVVAAEMHCFEKISFLDDQNEAAIGTLSGCESFLAEYPLALVALDDSRERLKWLRRLENAGFCLAVLVSPSAYVSPSAQLMAGTVIGPEAVIQAKAVVAPGCMVCAGTVIGQGAFVEEGCELCGGSVVPPKALVPAKTKIGCGQVFRQKMETEQEKCCPDAYYFEVGM